MLKQITIYVVLLIAMVSIEAIPANVRGSENSDSERKAKVDRLIERLLVSKNSDALSMTLKSLRGVPINAKMLKRMKELLQSKQYHPIINFCMRWDVAKVIGADPSDIFAKEKVLAIIESLKTVKQLPMANDRFQYDWLGTCADNTYDHLTKALVEIKGADKHLQEITNRVIGEPRMCVLIARAHRGDASEKSELCNILKDPNNVTMTMMRCLGTAAFERIGTNDDLPFLRELLRTDPIKVLNRGGPLLEMIDNKPINNTGERAVIYEPQFDPGWARAEQAGNLFFPVRGRANRVIEVIEKKNMEKQINKMPKE